MSHGSTVPGDADGQPPVAEAERLLAKITSSGDWRCDVRSSLHNADVVRTPEGCYVASTRCYPTAKMAADHNPHDAEFIAAAPRLVRELLALLQAQDTQPAQAAQPSNHLAFVAGPADAPKHYCTGDGCRACLDALDVPVAGPADAGSHAATLAYVLGQLRHAYHNLIGPEIAWDREHRMRLADGLISPQIMRLEQLAESMASTSAPAAHGFPPCCDKQTVLKLYRCANCTTFLYPASAPAADAGSHETFEVNE